MTGASGLLPALKERLAEVEQSREDVSAELARLESVAAALSDESLHLRALIERHEAHATAVAADAPGPRVDTHRQSPPEPSSNQMPEMAATAASPAAEGAGTKWLVIAEEVLGRASEPLHYRELYKRMKSMGAPSFGGQNPVATFLAAVSRESARSGSPLVRVGRGQYALGSTSGSPTAAKRERGKGKAK